MNDKKMAGYTYSELMILQPACNIFQCTEGEGGQ